MCCCGLHDCRIIASWPPETPPHQVSHELKKEVLGLGLQSGILGLTRIIQVLFLNRTRIKSLCVPGFHTERQLILETTGFIFSWQEAFQSIILHQLKKRRKRKMK